VADDVFKGLKQVDESVLPQFDKTAESLIEQYGAKKALTMALAYISGQTQKIGKRSLLNGQEGYETIELKCDTEIRNPSFAFTLLNKIVSD
jgi:hypothetical protein